MRVGAARRLLDLRVGRLEPPVADVRAHRVVEEEGVLADQRDRAAQRRHACSSRRSTPPTSTAPAVGSKKRGSRCASVVLPPPDIPTSASVRPGSIVSETPSSANGASRRLPPSAARPPARGARRVAEGDAAVLDAGARRRVAAAERHGPRAVDDLGGGVQQLEEPLPGRDAHLDRAVDAAEVLQRLVEQEHPGDEGQELPLLARAADHREPAVDDDQRDRGAGRDLGGRERERGVLLGLLPGARQARVLRLEAAPLVLLAPEGLHDAVPEDRLLQQRGQAAGLALPLAAVAADLAAEAPERVERERQADEAEGGQHRVEPEGGGDERDRRGSSRARRSSRPRRSRCARRPCPRRPRRARRRWRAARTTTPRASAGGGARRCAGRARRAGRPRPRGSAAGSRRGRAAARGRRSARRAPRASARRGRGRCRRRCA